MRWIPFLLYLFLVTNFAFGNTSAKEKAPSQSLLDINKGSGTVEFEVIGRPGAIKIHGKGGAPKGVLTLIGNSVSGAVDFDLTSLDTGINMRNEHMKKKYLETEKFPSAKLLIKTVELPKDFNLKNCALEKAPFTGNLTVHGIEKPVSGFSKVDCKDNKINFTANFGILIEDFGIPVPSFSGVTVAKDVNISVSASAPISLN